MTNKTINGKCTCEHSFSTNFLATSCEVFTWIGMHGETIHKLPKRHKSYLLLLHSQATLGVRGHLGRGEI